MIVVATVLTILSIMYGLYITLISLFGVFNVNKINHHPPSVRFAIVIAARNEEKVLGGLIDSLQRQSYPKELFDIYVVPNNCIDNTENIAKESGAIVLLCDSLISSKGDALKFAFNEILTKKITYDAFCIFDADNIVDSGFLIAMNNGYLSGYRVIQGNRDSRNPEDSWVSSCMSLFYLTQNIFLNKARMNIGLSTMINGTGFIVATEYIKRRGFDTYTMTEDVELATFCAFDDEKIAYHDNAITYDEQVTTFSESITQRMRWTFGALQCFKRYTPQLITQGILKKSLSCIDAGLYHSMPILFALTTIANFINFIVSLIGGTVYSINLQLFIALISAYITSCLPYIFVLYKCKKPIKKYYKGFFMLGFFMLTWLPITITCLFKRKLEWIPIAHKLGIKFEK